jgi:hypothetical protein
LIEVLADLQILGKSEKDIEVNKIRVTLHGVVGVTEEELNGV